MIIYNVTINVDESVHEEWLKWMRDIHIPEVLETGMFVDAKMLKLVNPKPDEGVTYAIQYTLKSIIDLEIYKTRFGPALQKKTEEKFGGKFHAFRSILETVD